MLGSSRAWTALAWAVASSALSRGAPSAACLVRQDAVGGRLPACTGNEVWLLPTKPMLTGTALQGLGGGEDSLVDGARRVPSAFLVSGGPQVCRGLESRPNSSLRPWQSWSTFFKRPATWPLHGLSALNTKHLAHNLDDSPGCCLPDQLCCHASSGSCLPLTCPAGGHMAFLQVQLPFCTRDAKHLYACAAHADAALVHVVPN